MRIFTKKSVQKLLLVSGLAFAVSTVSAQDWPSQPIRIVVPFPPGGTTDIMGRLIAEKLSTSLDATVLVENLTGAGGRIGADRVAKSAPDGYTLLLGSPGPLASYQLLYSSMPYDSKTDFDPVALIATLPQTLVVRSESPISSVSDLLEHLSSQSGQTSFGTPGIGSSQHLTTELFMAEAGIQATNVPYRGSTPMLTDVVGGVTDFAFDQLTSAMTLINSGRLRALAVSSPERSEQLPDVPTLAEAGVDVEYSVWFALAAPSGTPPAIIETLNAKVQEALAEPDVRARIATFGAVPGGGSPSDLQQIIDQEVTSVERILATTPITLD